jgi:hypothetical protein
MISNLNAPPALPIAPDAYDRFYQDQFANVLRIYFNTLYATAQDTINATNSNSVLIWLDMNNG